MYTTSYAWRIVTSTDPDANLDNLTSPAPILTADDLAIVVLELNTSNANGTSDPVEVTITIDNSLTPLPSALTFFNNIRTDVFANCIGCHNSGYSTVLPVYFDEGSYNNKKDLYRNVLDRVDLDDPENSLLLREPTSEQHGGGGSALDPINYNTILNWIRNGAPCGSDQTYC
jgi:hypothetical protein